MEKVYVQSSNVEAVGYEQDSQTLRIWFHNGTSYEYSGVSQLEYEGLRDATSVGSYLHQNIKGQYPYVKVE